MNPIRSERRCIACGAQTNARQRRRPGTPVIMGLVLYLYRRGTGKGTTRTARAVHFCESCLADKTERRTIAAALIGTVEALTALMQREEAAA